VSSPQHPAAGSSTAKLTWTIFLVSAVGLFLELMLIRWIGTEIRIFAYLQNTVLIVCFLGLGMGCFTCRRPVNLTRLLAALVLLTAILSLTPLRNLAARITTMLGSLGDLVIWQQAASSSPWLTAINVAVGLALTFGIMVLLWEIFMPLGRVLGRSMNEHPTTIWAYSVNVTGSLVGIWVFVLLSSWAAPPLIWMLTASLMLLWFVWLDQQRMRHLCYLCVGLAVSLFAGHERAARQVAWSPYQKLALGQLQDNEHWSGIDVIMVNNAGYQALFDLGEESVRQNAHITPDMYGLSQYDVPLLFHPKPDQVLIVGAGAGNDVAGALRGGAEQITAVEIDPTIIEIGREHHPERPYDSSRVQVVNDDARSFFATTDAKYDLIIFGLLDSHTTTAMTNARLDHYVYTRESLTRARSLLSEDGVMVLSFEAMKPFIADRIARCLKEVFGTEPLAFRIPENPTGWGGAIFVVGDQDTIEQQLATQPSLASKITAWQTEHPMTLSYTTRVATDDWPYLYLQRPWIPTLYYLLAGLMVLLAVYSKFRLRVPGLIAGDWGRSHWHFFFLGAAFLLLEVQNISKASVVLGNTWLVNAIIISGILAMILLANLIAARFKKLPRNVVACGLIASCLALYFVDLSRLAFLPFATKAILVGALTTLPMFFSGIIFINSFARVKNKDLALGANLIGALAGGMLQSITFVTGIKSLLLIVAGLYVAAMLTRPQHGEAEEQEVEKENRGEDRGAEQDLILTT